jgi:hypothetical protein
MTATQELNFGRDVQGYNAYAPKDSTNKYSATITDGTAASITVPSNYEVWIVAFSFEPGANVWVDFTTTAAIPAGATFATTTASLNPGQRTVLAGTVISLITDNTVADVGIELWGITRIVK